MDNKEAIEILNQQKYPYPEHYKDIEVNEALDLAIKALEERPQGKWELFDNSGRLHRYSCSICGHQISCVPSCLQDYKGCYCGAKMRKGDED